jgi:hypothetical protein
VGAVGGVVDHDRLHGRNLLRELPGPKHLTETVV